MRRILTNWGVMTGAMVLVSGCLMTRERLVEPVYMGGVGASEAVTAPHSDPMRFPRLSMQMPEGPVLDLGVVVMPDIHELDRRVLLRIADELGADGFVIERRALVSVYELPDSVKAVALGQGRTVAEVPDGLAAALDIASFAAVVAGCSVSEACSGLNGSGTPLGLGNKPWASTEADVHTYVRAYRQSQGGAARPIPVEIALDKRLRDSLESFSSQAEQLIALHAMWVRGLLSLSDYGVLRASLSSET